MRYDIIKTENYLLVVDDSEITEDVWFYHPKYNKVGINYNPDGCKKIIAHLPLNSQILDGVYLLPSLEDEVEKLGIKDLESYYGSNLELTKLGKMWTDGFDIGYNQAKERYRFTEEDILKAYDCGRNALLGVSKQSLINFLSQPKYPIGLECEMEYDCCGRYQNFKGCDATADIINVRLKTTSNSQGLTILVGKYIYS